MFPLACNRIDVARVSATPWYQITADLLTERALGACHVCKVAVFQGFRHAPLAPQRGRIAKVWRETAFRMQVNRGRICH